MPFKHLRTLLACTCIAAIAACGGDRSSVTAPEDVLLSQNNGVQLVLVSGAGQSGSPSQPLAQPIVVRVLDQRGQPISGATVNFINTTGVTSPRQARTDANGYAQTVWTLGGVMGTQTLRISGTGGTLTVSATAVMAARLLKVSGDSQTAAPGTRLPAPLVVRALLKDGTPAAGVTVMWSAAGGGTLSAPTTRTAADGTASVQWTLGAAGAQTVRASTSGVAALTFRANLGPAVVPVARVTVTPDPLALRVGQTGVLVASAFDAQGRPVTGRAVTWSSSAPATASVAAGGVVTGVAAGTARVTATVDGVSASAAVNVSAAQDLSSLRVTPENVSVQVGASAQLTATLTDSEGRVVTGRRVLWASLATNIARVDSGGRVTGVSAGTTRVSATVDGKVAYANVTVTAAPAPSTGPHIGGIQINGLAVKQPRDRFLVQIFMVQDPDGVMNVSVTARSPDGTQSISCSMLPSQSYAVYYPGPTAMPWQCYMTLPDNAQHGTWNLDPVSATDSKGNRTVLTGEVLRATRPLNTVTFQVENLAYDRIAPTINGLTLSFEDYYGRPYVVGRLRVADVGSGVTSAGWELASPGGPLSRIMPCLAEGTPGVMVCRVPMIPGEAAGSIVVVRAGVSDRAGNYTEYNTARLEAAGYQARINIP